MMKSKSFETCRARKNGAIKIIYKNLCISLFIYTLQYDARYIQRQLSIIMTLRNTLASLEQSKCDTYEWVLSGCEIKTEHIELHSIYTANPVLGDKASRSWRSSVRVMNMWHFITTLSMFLWPNWPSILLAPKTPPIFFCCRD